MSVRLMRMLIGDRKKVAVNEIVGEGDGANRYFLLDMAPIASAPTATLAIFLTGVTAATNTYTVSGEIGRITFNVGSQPAAGATILANYEYYALSSGELSDILSGYTGSPYLAASNAALCIAADASKLFMYTLGDKTVDKRRVADNLIKLSEALKEQHATLVATNNYTASIFTFKDDSGTVYDGFDTAVAVYTTTGIDN